MLICYAIIAWMWLLGAGLLWMFIDELVPDISHRWPVIFLTVTWPLTLPSVIAWYSARNRKS